MILEKGNDLNLLCLSYLVVVVVVVVVVFFI